MLVRCAIKSPVLSMFRGVRSMSIKNVFLLAAVFLSVSQSRATDVAANGTSRFRPQSSYSDDLLKEVQRYHGFKYLDLSNNPLIFSSKSKIFEPSCAQSLVDLIKSNAPALEVLNLSLNRLPEESLISFVPLLAEKSFQYLDVTTNGGADSLEALNRLSTYLGLQGMPEAAQINILRKIIWIPESYLSEDVVSRIPNVVPDTYLKSHKNYYLSRKFSSNGSLLPS